jgi:hypothetical protein
MNTIYRIRAIGTDTYYSGGAYGYFTNNKHVENYSTPGSARCSLKHFARAEKAYHREAPECEIVPFAVTEIQGQATRA